jgi:uncharacterized protein involved in exopolysaccharide biosynthesis
VTISREVAEQRSKVIGQRDQLGTLRKLKDGVDLQRAQLGKINERIGELRQEAEAGQSGLTTLGNAVTPSAPYFPNKPLILLGAGIFGIAIGALSGLLLELLGRKVRSEGDVINGFDMPLFAVMPGPDDGMQQGLMGRVREFLLPRFGVVR